ncbi:helix-turn-helix domain-containing protein [Nonomuraea spiralis]|uniref:Helix-turn-helix domain-containing protein n=1 Tax=Nonomuraea spiralis TaxID=46182 RepID=A0ABV5IBX9_9ACTN|nr:helix-turn-helix domain-containing protein [Nonomuraea spiralis]
MARHEKQRIRDVGTLKALAHPLRMRLYRALTVAGTATASQLADQVDEAVSLVSYHLRKLAEHDLIEEAGTGRGDARERWWQPSADSISTRSSDFRDTPEGDAVHRAMSRLHSRQLAEMYDGYLDTQAAWAEPWRDSAFSSESLLSLTAEELRALGVELGEVVEKWKARGKAAREAGDTEGRENTAVHTYGFPFRT